MPELPPVIARFTANISEFKAGLNEAQEGLTKTAALSEAKMAEIEASVDAQVAEMAEAARLAGTEFDETSAKAELMAEKVDASSEESSGAFTKMAALGKVALLGIATAAIGVGYEAVKAADKYSVALAGIQGSAQLTSAQATAVGNAFLGTAGKTTVSAQEMATAFAPVAGVVKQLNGGVLTASASLDVMKAATTASEASGSSLASSTSDLVGVMQAFKISTSDAADTTNTLYNTSRVTGISIDSLSSTVEKLHTKLGPVAPNLADTSALMVDLAQNGVTGSRGVMALNTGMTTLLGGSKGTDAELKKLGVSVYNSKGQFVGMQSTIAQLQPKLAGMTQQQRDLAEKTLFGAGAANAMNLVISGGAAGLDKATAAVNTHGAAEAAASAKAHTLSGEWETLKSAIEDMYVRLGQKLIPIITKVIAVGEQWTGWLVKHKPILIALGLIIGTVLVAAITAYIASLVAAAAAQLVALAPIIAIVAAVALLAAGIYELYTHWSTIWGEIKHITSDVVDFIVGVFHKVVDFFEHNWKTALEIAVVAFMPFLLVPVLIYRYWGQISNFFVGLWNDVTGAFSKALNWIENFFTSLPGKILGWLSSFGTLLLSTGERLLTGLWNGIKNIWNGNITFFTDLGSKIIGFLKDADTWLIDAGEDIIKGLIKGIENMAGDAVSAVKGVGKDIVSGAKSVLGILSPSTVFADEVGQWIPKGIAKGITDNATVVKSAVTGAVDPSNSARGLAGVGAATPSVGASGGTMNLTIQVTQPLGTPAAIAEAIKSAMTQNGAVNPASYPGYNWRSKP